VSSQPKKVVVSVLGKSVLEGNPSTYTTSNGNTYECDSATSFLPILHEAGGGGVDKELLLIAPHSLLVDELENIRDTEDFKKRIASMLSGYNCCKNNSANISIIYNNGLRIDDNKNRYPVKIQPVQVRGNIGGYEFRGDPRTAFTATYHALVQIGKGSPIEEIIVDTTHGWNHILILTALGAQAYAKISGAKLRYYTTEPVVITGRGGVLSEKLNIFEIEGVSTILNLVDVISNFQSFSIRGFTLQDQQKIISIVKESISNVDEKIIVEFRRLLCGLSTAMIPYIHMKFLSLRGKRNVINNYLSQLGKNIKEVVDINLAKNMITYKISSNLLSYIIFHSINQVLDDLERKINDINNIGCPGQLTEAFIKGLHSYYEDKWPLMTSIMEHELDILFGGNGIGVASKVLLGDYGYVNYGNGTYFDKRSNKDLNLKGASCSGRNKLFVNACKSYKILQMLNNRQRIINLNNYVRSLIRNLYAHLGIQHFTITDPSNMRYSVNFFEMLEKARNNNGSICDLA